MKKASFILFLMVATLPVFAQKDSCICGIYQTREDLVSNHLSFKINTKEKGYKLVFPIVADLKLEVKIVTPEATHKFPKGTIYGYADCGRAYRYSPGGRVYAVEDFYRIEEASNLVIYTALFNSGSEYFYSVNLDSPIKRLNMKNLEQDFNSQPDFLHAVKGLKKKGARGGLAITNTKGRFTINDIYDETINKRISR